MLIKNFRLRHLKISIFLMLLIATSLYLNYRDRKPIAITFCLEIKNPNKTISDECPNQKTLRIPAAYFGLTDPTNPNNSSKHLTTQLKLEVEYPSMRPWSSVPWTERWSSSKIEIEIVYLTIPRQASEFRKILGPKDFITLMPETPYGLNYYHVRDSLNHVFQPIDKDRLIYIRCGKEADPRAKARCESSTFILFKHPETQLPAESQSKFSLLVKYRFSRVFLQDWEDIHAEIASLFESFETSN